MNLRPFIHYAGLAAAWGGVLGAAGSLFAAAAYYNHPWSTAGAPGWTALLIQAGGGAFTFAEPAVVYQTYGRVLLPAYLLILVGALGLQACCLLGAESALHSWGYRLTLIGLVMSIAGNLADYWLGSAALGQTAWAASFIIGTELGSLLYTVGAIWMGRNLLKQAGARLPRWSIWFFMAAPLMGLVLLFTGIQHIPGGFLFPVSLSWVIIGMLLYLRLPARGGKV